MKRLDLLTEKDLVLDNHYPVQIIFNDIYNDQYADTLINYISKGHGFGTEYGACVFPDDLDEYDIANDGVFNGVEFGLHNGDEIVIDYETLYNYLKKVCERYLKEQSDETGVIRTALNDFRLRYNIKNY